MKGLAIIGVMIAFGAAAAVGALASPAWTGDAQRLAYDDQNWNVAPYERGLNQATWKCRESRHRVAAMVWSTKRVLRGDGYRYSNLSILRALNLSIPARMAPTTCGDMLAAVVVLIETG